MEQTVLVIGYGSIGKRHSDVLNNLGYKVVVVSRRNFKRSNFYSNIEEALSKEDIQYIVIANETNMHLHTLQKLNYLGYRGKLLIEKPLALTSNINFHPNIFVGYNLRFHPIIQKVKKMLRNTKVLSVNCYVGQYLPTWRPNTDYTKCYSASKDLGGGVLNDLSHELDYLLYLFGDWKKLVSFGGKKSNLKIDSYDNMSILFSTQKAFNINLELNYLDRIIQRYFIINTDDLTIKADLFHNSLQINDEVQYFKVERNLTYLKQHIAILENSYDIKEACTLHEGIRCDNMIQKIEKSLKESKWIYNE